MSILVGVESASTRKLVMGLFTLLMVGVVRMEIASAVMNLDILLMLFTDMLSEVTSDSLVLFLGGEIS